MGLEKKHGNVGYGNSIEIYFNGQLHVLCIGECFEDLDIFETKKAIEESLLEDASTLAKWMALEIHK